jgi:hypothetical protein
MMTEALNLDGPARLELIYLDEPRELAYWAHVLSISEDELKEIVNKVGPRAIDVRSHLMHERHAERQRRRRLSPNDVHHNAQTPRGDPLFAPIVCCAAAVATAFGALAYNPAPSDKRETFEHEHGCEAAASSDPTIDQLRCAYGLTIARTNLADAADGRVAGPMR